MTIQLPLDQTHPIRPPGNLRDLQVQGPVHRVRTAVGDPAWLVTGYRELQELFLDPRLGRSHPEPGTGGIRFTIGVMVDSADEVDRLTEQMRAAGARVTKEPIDAEFFTGRSAYLCDPEGNYFEIAWADMPDNPVLLATRRAAGA